MAGIIRNLFKSKKSKSKEEADNHEDLAREISNRRSFRAGNSSSSSKSQRRAVARFADDGALSATAAYHTQGAPKLRKGPQSCPGGYREESDVSYESDKYSQKSGHGRRRDVLHQSMRQNYTIDEGRKSGSSRRNKSDFRRRGESSEYGSGDPSPVGGQYSSRHSHFEDPLEESENDDFSEKAQFAVIERSQQQYMQKFKESEHRRREEKRKMKQLEKECNDVKNSMFHYMNQLDKVKKERDCYRKELSRLKKQMELLQNNGFDAYHHLRQPHLQNPQQFPPALSLGGYNYMAAQSMNSSHHHIPSSFMNSAPPSSNTPMTMTSSGAGEAMANRSDVSFLQNSSSFMQATSSNHTPSPGFKVPANFGDEDTDEVKDYRSELLIETARCSKSADSMSISPSSSADSQVTLLDTTRDNKENRNPPTRPFSMMSI